MPEYSHLNLEMIAEAQSQKEVTANAILEALAKGAGSIDVSVAAGNVTLTEAQSLSGVIRLTGAPGASRVVTVDADISRAILFVNATTGGFTIEVEQSGGTNFPVPAGSAVLLLSTTQAFTFTRPVSEDVFMSIGGTWTNMPAALTEWLGLSSSRHKMDLVGFGEARLVLTVTTIGAATPAKIRAQYSLDAAAWDYLDATSGPTVDINTVGLKVSAWVPITNAARADVFLRLAGIDGDATADPVLANVRLQFR